MIPKAWMIQIEDTRELKDWNLQEDEKPSFLMLLLGAAALFVVIAGMIILLFTLGG